ncbi:hypothetical protein [Burkholderia gladioli]|uniref:hypothetical protein n=1 Tax=Burkholderia gladioli TaxID=28095 RepID=UPI0016420F4C|nr:hypothetical protein [Burkholderia gladioli]
MAAHITKFIVEDTADGYFTAHLDNGWVRIGLVGCECFAFSPDHAEYNRVVSLSADDIEAAHDEFMGRYVCA